MKNRLLEKMTDLKARKEKAFCAFLTVGFPDIKTTEKMIPELEKAGVDILELGFPFSDPLADGPTIQQSSQLALERGVTMKRTFELVSKMRKKGCSLPVLFFSYYNPIMHCGIRAFVSRAAKAGFDGVLIPDLPPEEEKEFQAALRAAGLVQVYLVTPTTKQQRASLIAQKSQGFIYYVSLRGVTGARKALPGDVRAHLKTLKRLTAKPILVGFGVSNPAQAAGLSAVSDGVIVGSALIDQLRKGKGKTAPAVRFIRSMVKAVKK